MWANQTDQSKTAVRARAAKLYDTTIVRTAANGVESRLILHHGHEPEIHMKLVMTVK